jgi:hypothetical protein
MHRAGIRSQKLPVNDNLQSELLDSFELYFLPQHIPSQFHLLTLKTEQNASISRQAESLLEP